MRIPERIIISRTDSIGDVVLTLPVAGMIRKHYPSARIIFMGRSYTKAVIECCENVDEFLNYDEIEKLPDAEAVKAIKNLNADTIIHVFPRPAIAKLAAKARIRNRIGTTGRIYHWFTCNKLVAMSRKRSDLHEAQLNLKLLQPLGINEIPSINEISTYYGFTRINRFDNAVSELTDSTKVNVIIHPGSRGSGREWGLKNFTELTALLNDPRFKVFISGTKEEGRGYDTLLKDNPHVTDLTGRLNISEFIYFISRCDVLVAGSTGPLHLAAASGIHAFGLYAPIRPVHPGRWAPIGSKARYFVIDRECSDCKVSKDCHCIREITPASVFNAIASVSK